METIRIVKAVLQEQKINLLDEIWVILLNLTPLPNIIMVISHLAI